MLGRVQLSINMTLTSGQTNGARTSIRKFKIHLISLGTSHNLAAD